MQRKVHYIAIISAIIVILVVASILYLLVTGNNKLPKGTLTISDSKGEVLAKVDNGSLIFDSNHKDYIENILDEAIVCLSDKFSYKIKYEELLESDIKITTYFSSEDFSVLKQGFNDFDFSDDKSAEIALCTTDGQLIATIGKSADSDCVISRHKLGSAIKPLSVYAPALKEKIINWSYLVHDSPFKTVKADGNNRDWPANYENTYLNKDVTVAYALKKSLNTVPVKILDKLTSLKSCEFLESVGIDVNYEKELSFDLYSHDNYGNLALGELDTGVTCEQLAASFQIFANGGNYSPLRGIKKIVCAGETIYTDTTQKKAILSGTQAEIMNLLLQGVIGEGGTAEKVGIDGLKIAGKTGTSENYCDNWFVGLTPDYVCAVWYGYSSAQESRKENLTVPVCRKVLSLLPRKNVDFPKTGRVTEKEFCVYTGLLANENCFVTEIGYYVKENKPLVCRRH